MLPIKPYLENRPWGDFLEFTHNTPSTVKIITVKAGEALSLQSHKNREEFWHIISGEGTVEIGEKNESATKGKEFFVPKETKHRISTTNSELVLLEIAFGQFDENDIIRYEDKYNCNTQ